MVEKNESNVIQFPEQNSKKVLVAERNYNKKMGLVFSLLSVIGITLFINQLGQSKLELASQTEARSVASFQSVDNRKEIAWENELAKQISENAQADGDVLASLPDIKEQLIFGFFEGKYGVRLAEGKIENIEFLNLESGEEPTMILDRHDFLTKYKEAFSIPYTQFQKLAFKEGQESFKLYNQKNVQVGLAVFQLNQKNQVISLRFEKETF